MWLLAVAMYEEGWVSSLVLAGEADDGWKPEVLLSSERSADGLRALPLTLEPSGGGGKAERMAVPLR
jgi:hypothetical protein